MPAPIRKSLSPSLRPRVLLVILALMTLVGAVACEGSRVTPRPSPSLVILQFTPRPSRSLTPSPSVVPSGQATWPIGWDVEFCQMFNEAVIAQQLVVDVERAMDEGNNKDARLLADELVLEATAATELLTGMTPWGEGESASVGIAALMDLAGRAGNEYHAWFEKGKRSDLRQARALRRENGNEVPAVNADLEALAEVGLACPGNDLVLEAPG